MTKVITKSELQEEVSGLAYPGYKGGYQVTSSTGWNEHAKTQKELVDLLYEEINGDPDQKISVGLYKYDNYAKGYYNLEENFYPIWT